MIDDAVNAPIRRDTAAHFPDAILDVLEAARIAEATATGSDRRRAYRDTRAILGALREAGYSVHELAEVMGTPDSTVRQRIFARGALSEASVLALTMLSAADLDGLNPQPQEQQSPLGFRCRQFAAADVVGLLFDAPGA